MWFKNLQIFSLAPSLNYQPESLAMALEQLPFQPCLPSLPLSAGWVAPLEKEGAPLSHAANGFMLICLQIEDKVLPATVIKQGVQEQISIIEQQQARKVGSKEKQQLKDDVITTLLPRAFSRYRKIYAYIDTQRDHLLLNTCNKKDSELFFNYWKRVLPEYTLSAPPIKKVTPILTHWLQHQSQPHEFTIEQACVLSDPNQQSRNTRCQQQDLHSPALQALLKEDYAVKQLALTWQQHIRFTLSDEFHLRSLQYQDTLQQSPHDSESPEQQFDTDFVLMTETLCQLFTSLLDVFAKPAQ